jgi:hypothetical protein
MLPNSNQSPYVVKILQIVFLKFDDYSQSKREYSILWLNMLFPKTFRILTNFQTQKNDAGGPPNTPRKCLQLLYCIIYAFPNLKGYM